MFKNLYRYKAGPRGMPAAELAAKLNETNQAVETLARFTLGNGVEGSDGPGGWHLASKIDLLRLGRTGASGIPALSGVTPGSSSTVRLWLFNGTTLIDSGTDLPAVYNFTGAAFAANTYVALARFYGAWFVFPLGGGAESRLALAGAGGIPARSGSTMGSGTVTLQNVSGAAITSAGSTVTAYNMSSTAVAASKYIIIAQIGGQWLVTSESC